MDFRRFIPELSDDEISDVEDFGFWAKVKAGKKNRRKKKPVDLNPPKTPHPGTSRGTAQLVGSSKQKRLSFWEKKALAFEKFGEATVRPQEIYRKFLLHRRKLNNGEYDVINGNPMTDKIKSSNLDDHQPLKMVKEIYSNEQIVVNDENTFMKMMTHLNCVPEFALDLEANEEHSYLGMTVLIQIGTVDYDFIIDCFPVTHLIISELKSVFENPKIVKYLFGSDNDVLWLQRDFFIYLVSAIDIQVLFQNILRLGYFDEATKHLGIKQKKDWYHKYVGLRNNATPKEQRMVWEINAASQPMSYEKFLELYHPSVEIDKDAQLADFRPRQNECEQYHKLLFYARNDVHLLLQVVMELNFQVPDLMKDLLSNAFVTTKKKLLNCYKRKSFPSTEEFIRINQQQLKQEDRNCAEMLYNWRDKHAKLIDESPQGMICDAALLRAIINKPKSETELERLVGQKRGKSVRLPESISSWKKPLLSLLVEGQTFYEKINTITCHNCRTRGHAAWGCSKEWSTQSTKQNLREDDASRHRQVARRNANKKRNKKMKQLQVKK